MLKTFAVALLVTAMSVGLAQAKGQKKMPGCAEGTQAAATCTCGPAKAVCKKGQWCHSFFNSCTQ